MISNMKDKYCGCLMGLVIGDAICAPFEGGILEKCLWKIIGKTKSGKLRYTDDTQMALDLGQHLVNNHTIDQDALAKEFASNYRWSRGYGPSTISVLKQIRNGVDWSEASTNRFKEGSFGNGAAMRIAVIALAYADAGKYNEDLHTAIRLASEVTHPNPLAIEGAMIIAFSILGVMQGWSSIEIINSLSEKCNEASYLKKMVHLKEWVSSDQIVNSNKLKKCIGLGTPAEESCLAAIYIALSFKNDDLLSMLNYINHCGGDTDTIGAMSGSIWGAANGSAKIPDDLCEMVESVDEMHQVAMGVYDLSLSK